VWTHLDPRQTLAQQRQGRLEAVSLEEVSPLCLPVVAVSKCTYSSRSPANCRYGPASKTGNIAGNGSTQHHASDCRSGNKEATFLYNVVRVCITDHTIVYQTYRTEIHSSVVNSVVSDASKVC